MFGRLVQAFEWSINGPPEPKYAPQAPVSPPSVTSPMDRFVIKKETDDSFVKPNIKSSSESTQEAEVEPPAHYDWREIVSLSFTELASFERSIHC